MRLWSSVLVLGELNFSITFNFSGYGSCFPEPMIWPKYFILFFAKSHFFIFTAKFNSFNLLKIAYRCLNALSSLIKPQYHRYILYNIPMVGQVSRFIVFWNVASVVFHPNGITFHRNWDLCVLNDVKSRQFSFKGICPITFQDI